MSMDLKKTALGLLVFFANILEAAPSDIFWTNCTTEVLATGTGRFDAELYFSLYDHRHDSISFLPTDVGFLLGVFTWEKISAEAGVDLICSLDQPFFFNGKIGVEEGVITKNFPSISLGIFNVGTSHLTHDNVVDFIVGKELKDYFKNTCFLQGTLYVGVYSGSHSLGNNRQGFMVGYDLPLCPILDENLKEKYHQWHFEADYASGKNTLGGGGFALTYFFNPQVSLQSGPVWFNSTRILGHWKWSIQLNIDFPIF